MKVNQVAAQLYTIRDFTKTPANVALSMRKIRSIGFTAVQVSGMGAIAESELMSILDGEGLACCATHEPGLMILDKPEAVVDRLQKLNCTYTAYPYPAGIDFKSPQAFKEFLTKLNSAGKVLMDNGKVLTYHNHGVELAKVNGKTILDTIYDETNSIYVQGEIDTHWIQAGGCNPVSWCTKLRGRLPLLHLKDYVIGSESDKPEITEIGSGNLEWLEIIKAAENSGCKWFIIEQDNTWVNNDPFESLKRSFEFVKNNLCN